MNTPFNPFKNLLPFDLLYNLLLNVILLSILSLYDNLLVNFLVSYKTYLFLTGSYTLT